MTRTMSIVIVDQSGKELATHKVHYGARVHVKEGDTVKRGTKLAQWDPYTRPILTEVDRQGRLRGSHRRRLGARADGRDEGHHQSRHRRLARFAAQRRPEAGDRRQGQQGQADQGGARRRCSLPAAGRRHSVGRAGRGREGGRRAGTYPDLVGALGRHHRRSAARCGAVRGSPSEGSRDHRGDLRHDRVRQGLQEQAAHHHQAGR